MNKTLSCTLLVTGTSIGAGMLALPLASGPVGLPITIVLLLAIWLLMTFTGFLVLEVNLSLPSGDNFSAMAKQTAGPAAQCLVWVSLLCLLYSLTGAYITGGASLLNNVITKSIHHFAPHSTPPAHIHTLSAIVFTTCLGAILWHSTKAVDVANRTFISMKIFLLIASISLMLPIIQPPLLHAAPQNWVSPVLLAPIFLASFGYHTVIPSLTKYHGKNPNSLKKAIIFGTSIPLALYLLWLICTLGIVPQHGKLSFASLSHTDDVAQLTNMISTLSHSRWINFSINAFSNIALITSFLGVTLGLFDFIAGVFKLPDSKSGRLITTCITLLPPFIFYLIDANGFLIALQVAAFFVILLEVILPAWMVHCLRRNQPNLTTKTAGGLLSIYSCYIIGFILIGLSSIALFHFY